VSARSARAALGLAGVVLVTGCGVQPDSSPRDVPVDERPISIVDEAGSTASGADRVYLIAPGEDRLLRSVPRDATTPSDLVEILLRGPNEDELQEQYSTFIPPTTELLGTSTQGQILTVDLTSDFLELTGQNLTQAIAQIVYTATELEGIEAVQIDVEGERLSVPTQTSDTVESTLQIYDFPNAVRTSQPAFPAAAVSGS
jgi:hypothetical protein